MNMRLKKLGAALFVVAALGAVLASSAFATAVTTEKNWFVAGTKLAKTITASASNKAGTTGKFSFELFGQPVEITSTAVDVKNARSATLPPQAEGAS